MFRVGQKFLAFGGRTVENARNRDLNSDIPVCLSTDTPFNRSCVFIDGPVTGLEQMFCRLGCRHGLIQTNVKFCVIDRDTLARYNPGETRKSTLTQTSLDQINRSQSCRRQLGIYVIT